ncbi:MAG TPA: SDR family NAD(P)-dependent oxidoreductase [Candidatus Melainabacteria bacterium]|nr:SDR family NAD(P)-dependent oxidoreductase [Candidatus Melainabacteria bacterium]
MKNSSQSLKDRVAIVTGASSGIGEATALKLAGVGMRTALLARREDRIAELANTITEQGGEAISIKTDMGSEAEIKEAVDKVLSKWGQVDVLVNNAGVMYLGPICGASTAEWKNMVEVNLLGLMYATHEVLPSMIEKKNGHIINVSSVSGRVTSNRSAVYSATKFAVGAFSEGLRQEVYKSNIRVTIIEPGAVLTELSDHVTHTESREKLKSWVAGMEALTSEDIANSILYAVSQPTYVSINEMLIRPTEQSI